MLRRSKHLVIAGWTGRNVEALEAHIKELEALGVKRPKSVPIFYRVAASLLTTADSIEVMADKSSGEVEFVLYRARRRPVARRRLRPHRPQGRDHRRHAVEADVRQAGRRHAVALRRGQAALGQAGAALVRAGRRQAPALPGGAGHQHALARGTDPALHRRRQARAGHRDVLRHLRGARRHFVIAARFDMELEDPVLGRKLTHGYDIVSLPDEG